MLQNCCPLVRYIICKVRIIDNILKFHIKQSNVYKKINYKIVIVGLKGLCERHMIESLTPSNVANILLLADQCRCENLRKAALHYCEDSDEIKGNVHMGKLHYAL